MGCFKIKPDVGLVGGAPVDDKGRSAVDLMQQVLCGLTISVRNLEHCNKVFDL